MPTHEEHRYSLLLQLSQEGRKKIWVKWSRKREEAPWWHSRVPSGHCDSPKKREKAAPSGIPAHRFVSPFFLLVEMFHPTSSRSISYISILLHYLYTDIKSSFYGIRGKRCDCELKWVHTTHTHKCIIIHIAGIGSDAYLHLCVNFIRILVQARWIGGVIGITTLLWITLFLFPTPSWMDSRVNTEIDEFGCCDVMALNQLVAVMW